MRVIINLSLPDHVLTGRYSQEGEHIHIICNSSAGAYTVNLPDLRTASNKEFIFYNPSALGNNNVTIAEVFGYKFSNGARSHVLIPNDSATFVSDLNSMWLLSDINQ
jgi:hypothetical protein